MKILITGGAGFVGTNLIHKILKEQPGTYIQVLDNYSTSSPLNKIDNDRVTYHEFDLTDYFFDKHLHEVVVGEGDWKPDVIYHLAALASIFQRP